MEKNDYKNELLKKYVTKISSGDKDKQELLYKIGSLYLDDQKFLFEIYRALRYGKTSKSDALTQVYYKEKDEEYFLGLNEKEISFDKKTLIGVIAGFLDLLEDMLPLGTVVDIRKDIYRDSEKSTGVHVDDFDDFRMVITHRFLGSNGKMYYPYAGVAYPTGMLDSKEVFYFTRPMVDEIVQLGFQDEKELQFQFLMKNELIIENGMRTAGYAETDDVLELNREIKSKVL